MADRILPTANHGSAPAPHAYNAPDLSPKEFLLAVMNAQHQPMSIRIAAASALLPYTHPSPRTQTIPPRCTIVIPPFCSPWPREAGSAADPTEIGSENLLSASKTVTRDGQAGDSVNFETNSPPQTFIDYSIPPTPAELQEIKTAINQLRPDLAHLPIPEPHLCASGHWIFGPCPLGERCCDRTKLN
jgi:hypothetical protein